MRFPLVLTTTLAEYIIKNKLAGRKQFPLVLMLEPLHRCNLSCAGCGRIREYHSSLAQTLTPEQCLAAVAECGAPVVSICGGEPLIYSQIGILCEQILAQGKFIYLCTNGTLLAQKLGEFHPHSHFFINVHLDGMEGTHDRCAGKAGVFQAALQGIRAAKAAGFMVCTNTTVYRETDMGEVEELLALLATFNVDGFLLSPGYEYAEVSDRALFMTREDIHAKFANVDQLFKKFKLFNSPVYLEFLQGKHEGMPCAAWGNPTYNPRGWKSPCYLVTDTHYPTYREMMEQTPWERYGKGNDPRCENCMVHCGYEPAAALGLKGSLRDLFKQIAGQF